VSWAIDILNHIDKRELRESYIAHIPQLGIETLIALRPKTGMMGDGLTAAYA